VAVLVGWCPSEHGKWSRTRRGSLPHQLQILDEKIDLSGDQPLLQVEWWVYNCIGVILGEVFEDLYGDLYLIGTSYLPLLGMLEPPIYVSSASISVLKRQRTASI
jgi:hypothetical protein